MSEITKFSNEKLRVAADILAQLDNFGMAVINEWNARPEVQPANTSDTIDDGSGEDGDGRPQLTGQKIHNIMNRLIENKTAMDLAGVRDTILQMAVNTQR